MKRWKHTGFLPVVPSQGSDNTTFAPLPSLEQSAQSLLVFLEAIPQKILSSYT